MPVTRRSAAKTATKRQAASPADKEPATKKKAVAKKEVVAKKPAAKKAVTKKEETKPVDEKKEPVTKKPVAEQKEPVTKKPAAEKKKPVTKKPAAEKKKVAAKKPVAEKKGSVTKKLAAKKKEAATKKAVAKKEEAKPVDEKKKPEKTDGLDSSDEESDNEEEFTELQDDELRKEILGDLASDNEEDEETGEEITLDNEKLKESMKETKILFDEKKKNKNERTLKGGVVYLGRIPHGFYENEMRGYFKQFGRVLKVRVVRSRKTGRSKHFGFIQFADSEVAQIVSETMDNYLLFGHLLQCKVIPAEKAHINLFRIPKKFNRKKTPVSKEIRKQNKILTTEKLIDKKRKLRHTEKRTRAALKKANIDYDFPGYPKTD